MKRRSFLASAAAAGLALPAAVRAQSATTLRFIPQIDLTFLDPHFTTANVTRVHGFMVFDTLFGEDGKGGTSHQMLAGHVVEDGGKLWKLTLRDGLVFHDGAPVLARDCVASIKRWARRDPIGDALMAATDDLSAPSDKVVQFRLKKPFPLLPYALGKAASPMCGIMPARLAETDAFQQVSEVIGSGPLRYVADERVQGATNVYARFEKYVPRGDGAPTWTAGPKVVHFDRIVWTTMPDNSTKANALMAGEQDWWENPSYDLMPLLRPNKDIVLQVLDPMGGVLMVRGNMLQPPFNNVAIRRALLEAIDQTSFMQAVVGDEEQYIRKPYGVFPIGAPMASDVGMEALTGPRDLAKVREKIKAAGYAGEKVVLIVPIDYVNLKATADVWADMLKKVGMNVDYVATDWGQMLTRRNNKGPIDQGGWSCFTTGWSGSSVDTPAGHPPLRGNGDQKAAWPGWYISPEMEAMRAAWFDAPDLAGQRKICADMQRLALKEVPFWPLGQSVAPTAFRRDISGVVDGFAVFWNVHRG
ncbi:MAG: ABC transporter substrate-binding protein [Acetobacteraceae bacterium]|nr:ABC transporter substrate-binding protein [Acetobacteraceae bacterium]